MSSRSPCTSPARWRGWPNSVTNRRVSASSWEAEAREACARHRELAGDTEGFVAHAEACRERGARPEHLDDLLLAWAASRGETAAVKRVDELVAPELAA